MPDEAKRQIYYSILVLAIVGAGGIFTGTNPSYTPMELEHHFKASEAKFLVSEPEILGSLKSAAQGVGISESNILIFNALGQDVPSGFRSWDNLLKAGEKDWVRFDDLKTTKETTAARLFSSGTTGLPKAVTITHYNMAAQHELVFEVHPRPYRVSIHPLSDHAGLTQIGMQNNSYASFPRSSSSVNSFLGPEIRLYHLHHAPLRSQ